MTTVTLRNGIDVDLRTWIDHPMDTVIAIKPESVSGFRLSMST